MLEAQEVMKQGGTKLCSPQTCIYGLNIIKVKPQKLLLNIKTDMMCKGLWNYGNTETKTILQQKPRVCDSNYQIIDQFQIHQPEKSTTNC